MTKAGARDVTRGDASQASEGGRAGDRVGAGRGNVGRRREEKRLRRAGGGAGLYRDFK